MPSRQFATDSRDQQEAGSGYFAPVERTRHMLLTTFERGGSAVSAPVSGVADGDRAYFWTRSGSASARLLRHTDAVQVTPCSTRGFITYGLPLNATARLLHGGEASRATGKLASKHPVQHRFLTLLLQWARRRQMMIYELLADDAQGQHVEDFRAPDRRGDQSGGHAVHASGEVARVYWVRTHVTDCGVASIACIWAMPAHVTLPSAKEADRQARLRASGSTRRPAAPPRRCLPGLPVRRFMSTLPALKQRACAAAGQVPHPRQAPQRQTRMTSIFVSVGRSPRTSISSSAMRVPAAQRIVFDVASLSLPRSHSLDENRGGLRSPSALFQSGKHRWNLS